MGVNNPVRQLGLELLLLVNPRPLSIVQDRVSYEGRLTEEKSRSGSALLTSASKSKAANIGRSHLAAADMKNNMSDSSKSSKHDTLRHVAETVQVDHMTRLHLIKSLLSET